MNKIINNNKNSVELKLYPQKKLELFFSEIEFKKGIIEKIDNVSKIEAIKMKN